MTGLDQLDAMIASIRKIPELGRTAAPDVARVVRVELERTIAAGTTPDGETWQATKEGGRPLANAANALHVGAVGSTVYVRLKGPEARHHLGRARGGIAREIIPTSATLPRPMAAAISDELTKHFKAAVSNG